MRRALVALGLLASIVLAGALAACNVNEYCLNCATEDGGGDGDGGMPDAIRDGGAMPDACIPNGAEVCDGLDNDCDGDTDEDVPTVGDACGADVGVCTVGVIACDAADGLSCTGDALQAPESCDDLDNDCDGVVDDNNPEGGERCGTDLGDCVAGFTMCIAGGVLDCVGDMGTPGGVDEECDGRDNDCDGAFDEDLPALGSCGATDVGECEFGTLMCVGGGEQCVDYIGPTFEECDTTLPAPLDSDCDGFDHNGYDLDHDVRNCGACGASCVGTINNATAACDNICLGGSNDGRDCDVAGDCPGGTCGSGGCVVGNCDPGFYDIAPGAPGSADEGCEYACDFQGPQEDCNSEDDNCNGVEDEGLIPPPICLSAGACASTIAECTAVGPTSTWECNYSGDVSTDLSGNIIPETECDNVDNDCDGKIDEGDPTVLTYTGCADAAVGVCQRFGHMVCDPADQDAAPICSLDLPVPIVDSGGATASAEICDGQDNDCDTFVDDGIDGQVTAASRAALQTWVTIGNGTQIMAYEASRPDASNPDPTLLATRAITTITRTSNVVAVTTSTPHIVSVGQTVVIAGVTNATFNGTFTVTGVTSLVSFTYAQTAADASSSGGTVTPPLPAGFPLGVVTTYPCSRSGVQPWTNVKQPDAEAACAALGARLCTEQEWHRACADKTGVTYPIVEAGTNGKTVIEAEDYLTLTNATTLGTSEFPNTATGVTHTWSPDYTSGYSGYSALRASPNNSIPTTAGTGANVSAANAAAQSPRLDYPFTVTTAGAHHVWVRMWTPANVGTDNDNDSEIHVGFSAAPPATPQATLDMTTENAWTWIRTATAINLALGDTVLSIYMKEDGARIDEIVITRSTSTTAPTDTSTNGNDWTYGDTYAGSTCNGEDNDGDVAPADAGDQDDVIATGAKAACFADWGAQDVFDMSGNVKEWTKERLPANNPLRGGASTNEAAGITCSNAFSLADDDFFFNNVGFRCCR